MNINVSLAIDNGDIHGRYHYSIDKLDDVFCLFELMRCDINRVTNYNGEESECITITKEHDNA